MLMLKHILIGVLFIVYMISGTYLMILLYESFFNLGNINSHNFPINLLVLYLFFFASYYFLKKYRPELFTETKTKREELLEGKTLIFHTKCGDFEVNKKDWDIKKKYAINKKTNLVIDIEESFSKEF